MCSPFVLVEIWTCYSHDHGRTNKPSNFLWITWYLEHAIRERERERERLCVCVCVCSSMAILSPTWSSHTCSLVIFRIWVHVPPPKDTPTNPQLCRAVYQLYWLLSTFPCQHSIDSEATIIISLRSLSILPFFLEVSLFFIDKHPLNNKKTKGML